MADDKENKEKNKKERRPSAIKRDMQSKKRRLRNKAFTSQVKTAIKHLDESISTKDQGKITEKLNEIYGLMDKGVNKGVFKANKASRTKSRLAARAAR